MKKYDIIVRSSDNGGMAYAMSEGFHERTAHTAGTIYNSAEYCVYMSAGINPAEYRISKHDLPHPAVQKFIKQNKLFKMVYVVFSFDIDRKWIFDTEADAGKAVVELKADDETDIGYHIAEEAFTADMQELLDSSREIIDNIKA